MLKTLAGKHRSTVSKMAAQIQDHHRHAVRTAHVLSGQRRTQRGRKPLVARFGGIPLKRQKKAVLHDRQPSRAPAARNWSPGSWQAGASCASERGGPQVHQVRKLADLTNWGSHRPAWARLMAKRRRKTLIVCRTATTTSTHGQPAATLTE